ncbi:MAG TPA: FAD-dependent oxidoreductase [Longimicrobium sp.]|nr:FAD-dependent oxidoreductase [Longimicrobium sp.]
MTARPDVAGPEGGVDRRAFLRLGLAGAAVLAVGGGALVTRAAARKRVVVAGAGLAGLSAAYELHRAGHDVQVLEARRRCGGRVHTLREPFREGQYAEAGAVYVLDTHAATLHYARRFGVALLPSAQTVTSPAYHVGGLLLRGGARGRVRWPLELPPGERVSSVAELRARYLDPLLDQAGDPRHPNWPDARALALDGVSLAECLRRRGASSETLQVLRLEYLEEWGDGAESYSALSLLRDLALNRASERAWVIEGGTDRLVAGFVKRLPAVRMGAPVVRVEHDAGGVRVVCRTDAGPQTFDADHLVLAIPYSVLRTVEIRPALSPPKLHVVRTLAHTSVTRIYVQFSSRPWERLDLPPSIPTDLPIMLARDASRVQKGPAGILEAFVTGPQARAAAALPDAAAADLARRELNRVYPAEGGLPIASVRVAWDGDPWARGDYAWFRPGQLTSMLPHLAAAEGRLHFAGDQTSALPGWMQGALESGVRTAREIDPAIRMDLASGMSAAPAATRSLSR